MPWGDGTGPAGLGPMTGRAAGYCAGYPMPGYMNPIPVRNFSYGGLMQAYSYIPYLPIPIQYSYGYPYAWFRGRGLARGFGRGGRGRRWW